MDPDIITVRNILAKATGLSRDAVSEFARMIDPDTRREIMSLEPEAARQLALTKLPLQAPIMTYESQMMPHIDIDIQEQEPPQQLDF